MRRELVTLSILAFAACVPELEDGTALITAPRILAIRAVPAEAAPGQAVSLEALAVDPGGLSAAAPAWAFCRKPRPLAEVGPVDPGCLTEGSPALVPLGTGGLPGRPLAATLPADGCALFGPEPRAPAPGEPALRPVDPDPGGGFHQPVLALLPDAVAAVGRVRLRCALPQVPVELAARLRDAAPNRNPELTLDAAPPAGGRVRLVARIAPDAAEPYLRYDSAGVRLVREQETLRLSWFTTSGALGSEAGSAAAGSEVVKLLSLADAPAQLHVFAVLRDDRGGVGWAEVVIGDAAPPPR